ncbi:MAG: hypothetical protein WCT32_00350 [Patescibacteria group bacterium]|jgi:uncharacterized membrane protein YdjX (TVP38/TMEM64 family)
MQTTEKQATDVDVILNRFIAQQEGGTGANLAEVPNEKFLHGYSMGALTYSAVYFFAMSDSFFSWLSIISALVFFPALLILPFFARRRAWQNHHWQSYTEFEHTQKSWDRAGWYGLITTFALLYFAYRFAYAPVLRSFLPDGKDQLEQTKQELQDLQELLD